MSKLLDTVLIAGFVALGFTSAVAQQRGALTPEQIARRNDVEKQLEDIAIIDRKLMIPMRDGVRMSTDVYRPKNVEHAPIIFVRTPYNFNWWDVRNGLP